MAFANEDLDPPNFFECVHEILECTLLFQKGNTLLFWKFSLDPSQTQTPRTLAGEGEGERMDGCCSPPYEMRTAAAELKVPSELTGYCTTVHITRWLILNNAI